MILSAHGITDTGLMRSNNEDSFFLDEQLGLFIVADGMGGHSAGEVASRMAVEIVREKLAEHLTTAPTDDQLQSLLADTVNETNRTIVQAATENPRWSGMGTTLTILLLRQQQAHLAHVGDSRLYRRRNSRLEQLSEDQTLVADQLRRGVLNQAEAEQSNLRNILLQAIGVSEQLDIHQRIEPLQEDDLFLLCSDGLTGMLPDTRIDSILAADNCPQSACKTLLTAALDAGGKDNVTAVLVSVA
ncbi:protein phosphatase [Malonomonas rubra DSM 5091]|uniref:Protein phosphatase n=1 Tax=Malonomonas rubra DSM 5091 TaxID=1122189 RepID=A0A1M6GN27_MALRU|nr:Stp1/IreP family PP2C-type Ser/Thr phosphatase [Malonomonas rubra]SHJ11387.1 protein phosphatase [Malonomonas rubra DSM 5091]